MSRKKEITWAPRAIRQFNAAIDYIRLDSYQNAEAVKEEILKKISGLSDKKIVHRIDQYKKNNDGHFHFFELLNYRISYYENPDKITIVRLRHVSMRPSLY